MTRRDSLPRFYALHAGVPLLLALLLLVVFESTLLDVRLENAFFDPVAKEFPLRDDWFFETVVHDVGRAPVILVGVGLFAGFLLSFRPAALPTGPGARSAARHPDFARPRLAARASRLLEPWRRRLLYGALCVALAPLAVAGIKANSAIHCPRTLELYGGRQPYIRLLDAVPDGAERGHCWPGGHSSGGFALMSLYFVFRGRKPRVAQIWLVGGFAYGLALGMGRVVQGAHFVSHMLWAALVCWTVALLLYELLLRRENTK